MNNIGFQQRRKRRNERNLTILMLCWEYPPNIVGGLSRHVFGLSNQFVKMGYEVHVITAGIGDLPSSEKMDGVNVYRVKPINTNDDDFLSWIGGLNLAIAFKVEKLAEEIQFDLIHAHDWLVGAASISLQKILSIPLCTTIHATEHGRNNGIHTEMQQFIHNKEQQLIDESDHLIVCSDYMMDELISIFKAAAEKISVIPNGIEKLIVENLNQTFPSLKGKKYIFSLGRMVREKGFETIVDAAALAKDMKLDYYFVVAGKGPMLESFRQQIVKRELESYINFVGYINDEQRNALIYGCEMAVIPSLYEPFGIVVLESMSLGKPTIVSDTGGMKGIVKHLQTGLLMIPGDVKSLQEQIDYLIKNPRAAKEIGDSGRKIVNRIYSWQRVVTETIRVMEDTILIKRMKVNREFETPNKM